MKKEKTILFPTDFSDTAINAFRNTILFADQFEDQPVIQLLHIVIPQAEPQDFPAFATGAVATKMEASKAAMTALVETTLAQILVDHELRNVPDIRSDVEIGIPSNTISTIAKRDDTDLIIMGTQGEHSSLDRFFGSVTTATVRKAPCPVLVIPENSNFKKIETLGYATDFADTDPYHIWKMSKFLSPFTPIIRLVHIETTKQNESSVKIQDMSDFFEDNVPGLQITFHTIPGKNVAKELADFTDIHDVDLLVMHHQNRSLLNHIFQPSVTKNMALNTSLPILFFSQFP